MPVPARAGTAASAQRQFEDLRAAADAAAQAAGGWQERAIAVAGQSICLRFAGSDLLDALFPSFSHLGAELEAAGAATVEVFESADSGIDRPSLPWAELPAAGPDRLIRLEEGDYKGEADTHGTILTMAALPERLAVMHLAGLRLVPEAERGARLRPAILLALAALGPLPLHAGAVEAGGRGALLAGMSGVGKSTLAVACALEGMGFCGDDYVVLGGLEDTPTAHALNSTVRLSMESADLLGLDPPPGAFAPEQMPPQDPKGKFELSELAPGALRREIALRAIVIPRRDADGPPRQISDASALRALAPSTILQSPARRPRVMESLVALVRRLPCFELPSAGGPREAATSLRRLLESLD